MAQGAINIALGCNYLTDNGHIDINAGIFGILTEERLKLVLKGIILPAKNNTACKNRGTIFCSVNCHKSKTVYQVGIGHHINQEKECKRK